MEKIPCDPVNGNEVPNTPDVGLVFMNDDTENPHTVTIITVAKVGGIDVENVVIELAPKGQEGSARVCGNFSSHLFGAMIKFDCDSDLVTFYTYSST